MKIIGVIGQNGSGKDEVLKYLRAKYGVPFLSTGDLVREIAAKEGKEPTRENLQEISERYFREFGRGCFVKLAAEKIKQNGWGGRRHLGYPLRGRCESFKRGPWRGFHSGKRVREQPTNTL